MRLAGKTALVWGGTGTIGSEVVRELVAQGCKAVVFTYLNNRDKASKLQAEFGDRVYPREYNIYSIAEDFDIIVDAIGINIPGGLLDISPEAIRAVIDTNTTGMLLRLREATTRISDDGAYVVIGSSSVDTGGPTSVHYAASKAAIESAVRGAAIILGNRQARINELRVGYVDSPMGNNETAERMVKGRTCLGEFIPPEAVAKAVAWLASDEAKYITGSVVRLDGGLLY